MGSGLLLLWACPPAHSAARPTVALRSRDRAQNWSRVLIALSQCLHEMLLNLPPHRGLENMLSCLWVGAGAEVTPSTPGYLLPLPISPPPPSPARQRGWRQDRTFHRRLLLRGRGVLPGQRAEDLERHMRWLWWGLPRGWGLALQTQLPWLTPLWH